MKQRKEGYDTNEISDERMGYMGQNRQFKPGQKAPNNGIYVEIGETGSGVKHPKQVHLQAGDEFPETSNHNRIWTYKRKP
ncbi:hypothetical protein JOC93_002837 [Priestia taiwanensis]|uniref:YjzC family protein n=2 Tax=Priestia taiwanensis TaxID=1347902 RepID=A0A917AT56_9BACI|nr:hypothetical protein [Priestia taiwanensis]GGE72322.1 hypothetical protein GCM10007140_22800 [Priestia taiwanensis]